MTSAQQHQAYACAAKCSRLGVCQSIKDSCKRDRKRDAVYFVPRALIPLPVVDARSPGGHWIEYPIWRAHAK